MARRRIVLNATTATRGEVVEDEAGIGGRDTTEAKEHTLLDNVVGKETRHFFFRIGGTMGPHRPADDSGAKLHY